MVGSEGKRGSCGCVGARNSGLFPLLGSRSAHLSSSASPWLQTAASFSLTRLLVEPTLVEIPLEKTPVEISFTGDHTCCEKLPRENFHVRIKDHAVPACFLIIRNRTWRAEDQRHSAASTRARLDPQGQWDAGGQVATARKSFGWPIIGANHLIMPLTGHVA